MPRGDGTGPMGQGPRSGWGRGKCSGTNVQGNANIPAGTQAGMGQRRGFLGRCFGFKNSVNPVASDNSVSPTVVKTEVSSTDERSELESKAEVLQTQLDLIKKRIEDITKS